MGARGRKPASETSVVIEGSFGQRPEPPSDLTDRQAEIWRETVASEPSDFFSTAALRSLLADYCRHKVSADDVSSVINTFQPDWLKNSDGAKRYHGLLKMRDLESRAAASMATKLRLTNQSRYNALSASTAARNASKVNKPWEM